MKLLEENGGMNLHDLEEAVISYFFWGSDFLGHQKQAAKDLNKWDFITMKNFSTSKDSIKKVKKTYRIGENVHKSCI